jgi:hypothetical protein
MPSPITVNIKMDTYLIDYLVSIYGKQPIVFDRKDRLAGMLPKLLRKPNVNENQFKKYGEENLEIVLPFSEEKNVLYHNFMPDAAQHMFKLMIQRLFKAMYHDFMNDADRSRITTKEAVNTFIDLHQLDSNITDMLIKERQRFKEGVSQARWREKKRRQLERLIVQDEDTSR